jgi:hypothetical protein
MDSSVPPLLELIAVELRGSDTNFIGMATLISPRLAITAAQLVENHQDYLLDLKSVSNETRIRATVIGRDDKLGFAALETGPDSAITLPEKILSTSEPTTGSQWESLYFSPIRGDVYRPLGEVAGIELMEGVPRLKLSKVAPLALGIIGAPIVVDNQLVGVMVQDDTSNKYCYAIPVAEIVRNSNHEAIRSQIANESEFSGEVEPKQSEPAAELNETEFLARLSPSSRSALAHAKGILHVLERSKSKLHMEHLIAGLFQKEGGPTQKELLRAGIDREKLTEIVDSVEETSLPAADAYTPDLNPELPALSKHVREALIAAVAFADANKFFTPRLDPLSGSSLIRSRHLIRGALSVRDCSLIKALLSQGVDPLMIPLNDEPQPPRTPRRPTQAGIRSDDPEGEDLLDIKAEVEALCTVLASRDVKPPISLGLFGEWGSGKSFFMKKMEARFNQLKEVGRQGDSSYCANIVQLWFNAWHYMDTNLWASLATEIFDELAQELARQDALAAGKDPEYERAQLVAKRATATEKVTEAAEAKREADAKLRASEQQLRTIHSGEATVAMSPQAVLREGYRFAIQQPEVRQTVVAAEGQLKQKVQEAATTLNMGQTPDSVKQQLLELQGLWGYAKAIFLAIRNTKNKWSLILLLATFLILVVAIVWLLPILLAQPWIKNTWVRVAGVTLALLGAISPYLPAANRALKIVREAVKSNQESVEHARLEAERNLQVAHEQLQESAKKADEDLQKAVNEAQRLTNDLEALRADRKMSSFIRQRQQSSDYTRYLGVIAKARNDFEQLSVLIAKEQERSAKEQNAQRLKQKVGETNAALELATADQQLLLPRIDRIILYIDDLDRCPEEKVVDVLQAVHLLLAFPLFIVVVGVDPRWLLHSLRQHSKAFQARTEDEQESPEEESTHWQSTPLNYLEKIFQIPFTLWPMGKSGFGKMVDTLTEPPESAKLEEKPGPVVVSSETPAPEPPPPPENVTVDSSTKADVAIQSTEPAAQSTGPAAVVRSERSWHRRLRDSFKTVWPFKPGRSADSESPAPQTAANAVVTASIPEAVASEAASTETQEETTKILITSVAVQTDGQTVAGDIDPNPEHLQIKSWERSFMKQLHLLIPSPRATKRFVNVYRLIRASVDVDERLELEDFTGDENQGKYRAVLLLLAILTGYPDQATEMLRDLLEKEHKETWWEFIDDFKLRVEKRTLPKQGTPVTGGTATKTKASRAKPGGSDNKSGEKPGTDLGTLNAADAERWEQLLEKLDQLRGVIGPDESCADFVDWAPKVARYSFQSGRVLLTRNPQGAQNRIYQ